MIKENLSLFFTNNWQQTFNFFLVFVVKLRFLTKIQFFGKIQRARAYVKICTHPSDGHGKPHLLFPKSIYHHFFSRSCMFLSAEKIGIFDRDPPTLKKRRFLISFILTLKSVQKLVKVSYLSQALLFFFNKKILQKHLHDKDAFNEILTKCGFLMKKN